MSPGKLSILHLNAPTALAGAERVLLTYLENFDRNRFNITVASFLNHSRLDNHFTIKMPEFNIPYHKIPIGKGCLWREVWDTVRLLKEFNFDLVHTHGYRSDVAGFLAARIVGVPIIATVHGWMPISLKLRSYELLDRCFLKKFDKVICVSRSLYEGLQPSGFRHNLVYLHNAISINNAGNAKVFDVSAGRNDLGIGKEDKIVLSVGRLSAEKAVHLVVAAVKELLPYYGGKLRLVVVGDGPLRGSLEEVSRNHGIAEKVIFTGHVDDVNRYYASADIFVMSSVTEGSPMALLEAMNAGLPVVCTKVGGIPDIIQERVNGLLVEPNDVHALVKQMDCVLSNSAFSKRLSAEARNTISNHFDGGKWAQKIEKIYDEVCNRGLG